MGAAQNILQGKQLLFQWGAVRRLAYKLRVKPFKTIFTNPPTLREEIVDIWLFPFFLVQKP